MIGLNLYCGGASLGAGGGSPAGARLTAEEAKARREGGGEAALLPGARAVARPPPVGAEDPDVTAAAERRRPRSPGLLAVPADEMAAPAAAAAASSASAAIMSPEEELDGCEPEALGKRPAVLPLLERVSEAARSSGADGSLPSTPPPAEEEDEEDELYRQSLEIISRYLREQAAGAKDTKPLGEAGAAGRRALETLRRVGDGVQRNHETAFQGKRRPGRGGPGRAARGERASEPSEPSLARRPECSGRESLFPPIWQAVGFKSRKGWDVSGGVGSARRLLRAPGEAPAPRRGWARGGRGPPPPPPLQTKEERPRGCMLFLLLRHAPEAGH